MEPNKKHIITVYEHDCLKYDPNFHGQKITVNQYQALEKYHGSGTPYFKLISKGIQFNEYVGVIQVGGLTIEVLPKIDKLSSITDWQAVLINMLKKVGVLNVVATSNSDLKLKSNSILDLYFELFIHEVETILHKGLTKTYRLEESNQTALKGRLNFTKHIAKNIVHQERFYVIHTIYDKNNVLNKIIYKTLQLIKTINTNSILQSRIDSVLLNFPELPDIIVNEDLFERIHFNRKTENYQKAIEISKLLLLRYHPAVSSGNHHVLAIMFDMNLLWERFVYVSLKKHLQGTVVASQSLKSYYSLKGHYDVKLQPDIHVFTPEGDFIIDTKWKLPNNGKPAHADLQQMYAYTKYFNSAKTILCYPGIENEVKEGLFHPESNDLSPSPCSVVRIGLNGSKGNINGWMDSIGEQLALCMQFAN